MKLSQMSVITAIMSKISTISIANTSHYWKVLLTCASWSSFLWIFTHY